MYKITKEGKVSYEEVNKKKLAEEFEMHPRDLRPVFMPKQLYTISVRGHGIVVNMGVIKMCVGKDISYFFHLPSEEDQVKSFVNEVLNKITLTPSENTGIPFEFLVLEVGFEFMIQGFLAHFQSFERRLEKLLRKISDMPTEVNFEKLLSMKKETSRIARSIQELQQSLDEVLDDEDEILALHVSQKEKEEIDTEVIESILENILEQVMEISHKIEEKKENIDDTLEIVTLKMTTIRNSIIRFDLLANISSAVLTVGALVGGFYGMNVPNHLEENPYMFWVIVGGCFLFMFLFLVWFFRYLREKRIWT